jgi:lipid A 3-O-deacylase
MSQKGAAAAALLAGAVALSAPGARAEDPGLLALGAGVYDFIGNNDKPAAQFRAEYRAAWGLWIIKPVAGAFVTTAGTFYGYGGLRADIIIADHYVIMPEAAAGYWQRGDGKNLGSHAEFKTGGEVAYRFGDGSRLGLDFEHMSNAGITRVNPGEESLLVVYSLPLSFLP